MTYFLGHYYRNTPEDQERLRLARAERRQQQKAEKERIARRVEELRRRNYQYSGGLLRRLQIAEAERLSKPPDQSTIPNPHAWGEQWRILLNPEIVCPYCAAAIVTNQVWFLARDEDKMMAAFSIRTGARISLEDVHPHVFSNGNICMGNATNVVQALCTGLNQFSAYGGVGRMMNWISGMHQHKCWDDEKMHSLGHLLTATGECGCNVASCCNLPACQCYPSRIMGKWQGNPTTHRQ